MIPPCKGHELETMKELEKEEKRTYSRLKSLFFRLYELKSEVAFYEESGDVVDGTTADYINTQRDLITQTEEEIKSIITGE